MFKKLIRIGLLAVITYAALGNKTAIADTTDEITHLLQFIGGSQCVFIRNGDEHDSLEARDHIQMKYDYARGKIATAEDFIRLTATKSSMSGRLYMVRCGGAETPTGEWLLTELTRFRSGTN